MTAFERLASILAGVPADARAQVERLLREIAHDLGTPLAVYTMEVFSAQQCLTALKRAKPTDPRSNDVLALTDLDAILTNLEASSSRLGDYVAVLTVLAAHDSNPREPNEPA